MNNVINSASNQISIGINFTKDKFDHLLIPPLYKKIALVALTIVSCLIAFFYCFRSEKTLKTRGLKVESQSDLEKLLKDHHIDCSKWTTPISHLFKEIKEGKCTLELDGKDLVYSVEQETVVKCFAEVNGRRCQIYEKKQVYKNIKPHESHSDAVIRDIAKELQISGKFNATDSDSKTSMTKSKDYAGLVSHYHSHYCEFDLNRDQYKEFMQKNN